MDSLPTDIASSTNAREGKPTGGPEGFLSGLLNKMSAAHMAVQGALGKNPQGTHTSVAERLGAIEGLVEEATGVDPSNLATLEDGKLAESQLPDSVVNGITDPSNLGYDVVLLAGQSNMVGYGAGGIELTYLDTPDPRIAQYAGCGNYLDQIVSAVDPLFHNEQRGGSIGHAMSFGRLLVPELPTNRKLLLVPCAHGSTGFSSSSLEEPPAGYHHSAGGSWDPTLGAGGFSLYEFAIAQANAALALDAKNKLIAILWLQGEEDAEHGLGEATYRTRLDELIAGFRSRITGAEDIPFLLGQMVPERIAVESDYQEVNRVHIDTPRRNEHCAFYYGPTGYGDPAVSPPRHYVSAGQRLLGASAFAVLGLAQANVKGHAPVPPGAPVLVQEGTTVAVSWARPECRFTDFTVEVEKGSGWTVLSRISPNIDITAQVTGLTLGATLKARVKTVNEDGTSAASPVAELTLVELPAKVTGLASGTVSGTSVPLTWSSAARAASYSVEYRKHADAEWSVGPTVTATASTVSGLKASTAYDFRVKAKNAAGSGEASSTAEATTAAIANLLTDIGVAAYRAYGLRKLNASYGGKAIKCRRSSDEGTKEIGFVGNDLDTATLLEWAGSSNVFIVTLFDQSGNGYDITQATASLQPKIVAAGTLEKLNGQPVITFDGTDDRLEDSAHPGLYANGSATGLAVAKSNGKTGTLAVEGGTSTNTLYAFLQNVEPGQQRVVMRDDSGGTFVTKAGTVNGASELHAVSVKDTGEEISLRTDGAAAGSEIYSRTGHTVTPTKFSLGAFFASGSAWGGALAECIFFKGALTAEQLERAQGNQKSYWGTP